MSRDSVRTRDPERKSKILRAAAELIGREGYHAVSIADIGNEAGITGSGIYRHFDGKSAILVALFDDVIDGLIERQEAVLSEPGEPAPMLRALVAGQVDFVVGRRGIARVYFNEIQNLPSEDQVRLRRKQRLYLEEWVHLLQEVHGDLDDAECRILVHAAIGAIQSQLVHNVGLEPHRMTPHLARAACAVLMVETDDTSDRVKPLISE